MLNVIVILNRNFGPEKIVLSVKNRCLVRMVLQIQIVPNVNVTVMKTGVERNVTNVLIGLIALVMVLLIINASVSVMKGIMETSVKHVYGRNKIIFVVTEVNLNNLHVRVNAQDFGPIKMANVIVQFARIIPILLIVRMVGCSIPKPVRVSVLK